MKPYIPCLLVLLALSPACSVYHISSEDITTNYYPSKNAASEVVYIEDLNQPHEIIGTVTVRTERNQRISEVIEKIKREAAILGGSAITNIRTNATGSWKKLPVQNFIGNGFVRANFSATVVAFQ